MSDMVLNTTLVILLFLFLFSKSMKDCIWVRNAVMSGVIVNVISDISFFYISIYKKAKLIVKSDNKERNINKIK